jgi:hypothetical protein
MLERFKQACRAAGTAVHVVHDLRRSGVRNLVRGGASQAVAMSISGHRDPKVFIRYNVTSTEDRREALRGVERYRARRLAANTDKFTDSAGGGRP